MWLFINDSNKEYTKGGKNGLSQFKKGFTILCKMFFWHESLLNHHFLPDETASPKSFATLSSW